LSSETLPRTITHAFTGEQITFVETSRDTDGTHELIEVVLPPKGEGPRLHYHLKFEESFEVMDGKLAVTVGEKDKVLGAGGTQFIPKHTNHRFKNASDENPVTFRVKIEPANNFEVSTRIMYGLIRDGEVNEHGVIDNPMYLAIVLMMQDTIVVGLPEEQRIGLEKLAQQAKDEGVEEELINRYAVR
jgi:quercetin dioxygenase-like cupin family protein